jgi:hypothetical protein
MPYLDPALVLRELSGYAATEIRPAVADDEAFVRGQVGSMASTLRFLACELEGMEAAVSTQRESLLDALATAEVVVEDPQVTSTFEDAADRVAAADGQSRNVENVLLEAADDALAAVDTLEGERAREARAPLYEFLQDRLTAQLRLLGRPAPDG